MSQRRPQPRPPDAPESHDAETLEMASAIVSPSLTAVQVALNRLWERYEKPSPHLQERLRARVTAAVRDELRSYLRDLLGFKP